MVAVMERPGAPDRSREQRMLALAKANRVRSEKAVSKRLVKAGLESAAAIVLDPPECWCNAKVTELLMVAPRWGRVKAANALRRVDVSPSRTVSGLTTRQRGALAGMLVGKRPA